MTAIRLVHLWCDAEDCTAEWQGDAESIRTVRRTAREEGWRHKPSHKRSASYDLCPEHKEQHE